MTRIEILQRLKELGVEPTPELIAKADFRYFFEKVIAGTWAPHHDEWYDLLKNNKRILIECARGHGKTYFMVCYAIWLVYSGKSVDILIISYSEEQVKNNIMNLIDRIIMKNDYLTNLRPSPKQQWGAQLKTFNTGAQIRGESFGSSVRGAHPDYLFVDDPLKDKGGMTPAEQLEYYMTALMGTVKENTQVVVTGTPLDNGDLLEQLEGNKAYTFRAYPAENEERTKPLFSYLYSLQFLRDTEKERGSFAYSREYLLKRIDPSTQMFKDSYRTIDNFDRFRKYVSIRTIIDPAISEKEDACQSAIVTVGVTQDNHLYELDTRLLQKDNPKAILDEVIAVAKEYRKTYVRSANDIVETRRHDDYAIVVEAELFQKVLSYDLRQMILEQDLDIRVIEVTHQSTQGKHERIAGLQSKWETRAVHLLPESPLIGQFRFYRPGIRGFKLDGIDAFAWIRAEDVNVPVTEAKIIEGDASQAWDF